MARLTIEVSQDTAIRLEMAAQQQGLDLPTFVRRLLGDDDSRQGDNQNSDVTREAVKKLLGSPDDQTWLNSPEAVDAGIRALGPDRSLVREATANLADLLATGGVDQGMDPGEWDRYWALHEAELKAADLGDARKTQCEILSK